MAKKETKTNALRQLDQKKVSYEIHTYDVADGAIDGVSVANKLQEDIKRVFKTLVCVSNTKKYYVYVIPVEAHLDLKVAAKVANEKSIAMIAQKELLPLTGYIHGGCSPIGMKKSFHTFVDSSACQYTTIYVSAGKVGMQVELNPNDLMTIIDGKFAELVNM